MTKVDSIRINAQLNACAQAMSSLRAYDRGAADSGCTELEKLRMRAEFQFNALKALDAPRSAVDPSAARWAWLLEKAE